MSSNDYGIKIPEDHVEKTLITFQPHLSQVQVCEEECAELVQALSKHIRALQGTTKVTKEKSRNMIVEEVTHVAIVLHMLQKMFNITQEEIDKEIKKKEKEYG